MMKAVALFLLFAVCYVECRKVYAPINKNANIDFINMEGGGMRPNPPSGQPAAGQAPAPAPKTPPAAAPAPKPVQPAVKPAQPASPSVPKPAGQAPGAQDPAPQAPAQKPVVPSTPSKPQTQTQNKPVNPAPAAGPVTTPGPGSVKSLITFYDSQGKASPVRPYSYSQAVKQG